VEIAPLTFTTNENPEWVNFSAISEETIGSSDSLNITKVTYGDLLNPVDETTEIKTEDSEILETELAVSEIPVPEIISGESAIAEPAELLPTEMESELIEVESVVIEVQSEGIESIETIEFTILGNKEIKNMSVLGKDTPGLVVPDFYDNTEPKKGGLIDQRMGVTSNELECTTCGLSTNYCHGHFGHMSLSEPVFHMGFYEHVISILRCVCVKCSKLLVYKNETEIMDEALNLIYDWFGKSVFLHYKHVNECE
jgi:hypothetical protein